MKRLLVYIYSILSINAYGQTDILNISLTDSSKPVFYIGVENFVIITGKNIPENHQISISGADATINKIGKNKYVVRVYKQPSSLITYTENGKWVLRKNFSVKIVPDPIATLAGLYDTTINKNRILINPRLQVALPNCFYQHSYQIRSFQAVFINGSDSTFTFSHDNRLTEEQIKLVRQQTSGATIYFDNIRALSADSRTITLQPFWIKIE